MPTETFNKENYATAGEFLRAIINFDGRVRNLRLSRGMDITSDGVNELVIALFEQEGNHKRVMTLNYDDGTMREYVRMKTGYRKI